MNTENTKNEIESEVHPGGGRLGAIFYLVGTRFGDTYVPDNSPNCPGKLHAGISHYSLGAQITIFRRDVKAIGGEITLNHDQGSDCGTVGKRPSCFVELKDGGKYHIFSSSDHVKKVLKLPH